MNAIILEDKLGYYVALDFMHGPGLYSRCYVMGNGTTSLPCLADHWKRRSTAEKHAYSFGPSSSLLQYAEDHEYNFSGLTEEEITAELKAAGFCNADINALFHR